MNYRPALRNGSAAMAVSARYQSYLTDARVPAIQDSQKNASRRCEHSNRETSAAHQLKRT
jgi:hypothetical protein